MKTKKEQWAEAVQRAKRLAKKGALQAEAVLDDARDESSPLHYLFDWDDATAAESQRLEIARAVVRRIVVIIVKEKTTIAVPEYYRDPRKGHQDPGYVTQALVASDSEVALGVVRDEMIRAGELMRRALQAGETFDIDLSSVKRLCRAWDKKIVDLNGEPVVFVQT